LKGDLWNQCHELVIREIASQAIVNNNSEMLLVYLIPLQDASDEIEDWEKGGQLFLDYLSMIKDAQAVKTSSDVNDYILEQLHKLCVSVADRLAGLMCNNVTDRLSKSMMAKSVAKVLSTLIRQDGQKRFRKSATHLTTLPMPEDYALETLAQLSQTLVQSINA
jgi:hypothetical protein